MPLPLITISWIRNEEDIVERWARHHATLARRMYVILHRPSDRLCEMMMRLKEDGLPLSVETDMRQGHEQDDALTTCWHRVRDVHPDCWVLPLDGDEFLGGDVDGLENSSSTPLALPWKTYVPGNELTHRRSHEPTPYVKVCIPPSFGDDRTVSIHLGNHGLRDHVRHSDVSLSAADHDLFLAHQPIRSEQQLRRKILEGWKHHLQNPRRTPGSMFHWEQLVDRCRDETPFSDEELNDIALRYGERHDLEDVPYAVEDPFPLRCHVSA